MAKEIWYVRDRNLVMGPFSASELEAMRQRGQLARFHEISRDRLTWAKATRLRSLFPREPLLPRLLSGIKEGVAALQSGGPPARYATVAIVMLSAVVLAVVLARPHFTGTEADPGVGSSAAGAAGTTDSTTPKQEGQIDGAPSDVAHAGTTDSTTPKQEGTPVPDPVKRPRRIIGALDGETELASAIGLVICGLDVKSRDGSHQSLPMATGSCFAISPEGHLLTNKHVVKGIADLENARLRNDRLKNESIDLEPRLWVFFREQKFEAKIAYVSDRFDMAILKVDHELPCFQMGEESSLKRGTRVFALGFPGAARAPISAEEAVTIARRQEESRRIETYMNERDFEYVQTEGTVSVVYSEEGNDRWWIQHTAALNSGNSGGPLLLANGRVVGLNTLANKDAASTFLSLMTTQLKEEIETVLKK